MKKLKQMRLSALARLHHQNYLLLFIALAGLLLFAVTADYLEPASLFSVAMELLRYLGILFLLQLGVLILFPRRAGADKE